MMQCFQRTFGDLELPKKSRTGLNDLGNQNIGQGQQRATNAQPTQAANRQMRHTRQQQANKAQMANALRRWLTTA